MDNVVKKIERFFGGYEFGVFNETGGKDGEGAVWKVERGDKTIPYLKAMNARGRHIFVRPSSEREDYFMLHDDLDKEGLDRLHKQDGKFKPGRMVVESSTGNYQVWIRTDRELSIEEKKYWLKKMESDPGASPLHRWGRAPGFRNRKSKYEDNGKYPLAKLIWVDWKGRAKVPVVELPKPEISHQPKRHAPRANHGAQLGSLPVRSDFERGNESKTDYAYMLALMRRGVSDSEVEKRIRDERTDWSHHKSDKAKDFYFEFSIPRARALIESTPAKPRQGGRRDLGRKSEEKASSQAYRIVVKNVDRNIERSTVVEDLKEKEAKAILEEKARVMAVQVGFEKASEIRVDVEPVKALDPHKKKDLSLSLLQ